VLCEERAQPGQACTPARNIKVKVKSSSNRRGGEDACESEVKTRAVERLEARPGFGFRRDLASDGRIVHPRCGGARRRAERGSQVRCEEGKEAVGAGVRDEPWVQPGHAHAAQRQIQSQSRSPEEWPRGRKSSRYAGGRAWGFSLGAVMRQALGHAAQGKVRASMRMRANQSRGGPRGLHRGEARRAESALTSTETGGRARAPEEGLGRSARERRGHGRK
jgi:hypothetical protein